MAKLALEEAVAEVLVVAEVAIVVIVLMVTTEVVQVVGELAVERGGGRFTYEYTLIYIHIRILPVHHCTCTMEYFAARDKSIDEHDSLVLN